MVKTPRTRHSRTEKKPVTIDLAPDEVSRVDASASPDITSAKKAESKTDEVKTEMGASKQAAETKPSATKPTESKPATPKEADSKPAEPKTSTAKDTPPPSSQAQAPEKAQAPKQAGKGRGGTLLAGLAGGVAALALGASLQLAGVLPLNVPATSPLAEDHGPSIAALETQLSQLRDEMATLRNVADADAALAGRVTKAEEKLTALGSGLESLQGEVSSLEAPVAGEVALPDLAPFENRIAKLEGELAALPDSSPADAAIASLRGEVEAGQAQLASRLDTFEAALRTLNLRVDEQARAQAEAPSTALIIAASSLKAAIDRGTPFTAELDTYAALSPAASQLEPLRELAATGVQTRAQIVAGSDAAANAMIAAARPVDPQAGITERLWSSMMGLVQIRPIGMVEGEGVPEIVARLDAAVQEGNYDRALSEYDTLPPEAKAAGETFIARLRARHTADQMADEALAAALKP